MARLLIDWNNVPSYLENGKGSAATSTVQLSFYMRVTILSKQISCTWASAEKWAFSERETYYKIVQRKENPKYPLTQRQSRALWNGKVQKRWEPLYRLCSLPITKLSSVSIPCFGGTRQDQEILPTTISTQEPQHRGHKPLHTLLNTFSFFCHLFSEEKHIENLLEWQPGFTFNDGKHKESSFITWGSMHCVRERCGAHNFCFSAQGCKTGLE